MSEKSYDLTRSEAAEAAAQLVICGIWCSIHPVLDSRSLLVTLDNDIAGFVVNKSIVACNTRQISITDLAKRYDESQKEYEEHLKRWRSS